MSTPETPWWRDAICYQVYVRSFADSDGDGLGDLPGITSRLPYLRELGVDAIWITPFYPSPQHDAGYDVSDYVDVDHRFGTLEDADALLATAHELGLRVIVDIVPNHTSSEHAWFREALASEPGSPARERYLFRAGRGPGGAEPPNNWESVFGGPAWTRVPETADHGKGADGEWYLHLFDHTQPDLNWRNPEVPAMFRDVLRFWLDRGVDGFRVDVAHGLFKEATLRDQLGKVGHKPATTASQQSPDAADASPVAAQAAEHDADQESAMIEHHHQDEPMWDQPEVHDVYRNWHTIITSYDGERMSVAEAWAQTPEAMARYVRPDEFQQAFNFAWLLAPWSATAFAEVITGTLAAVEPVGASPTWVLSNHDVVRHPTRYGGGAVGLARARAATLTMLALPGSSYLYQGEELGLEEVDVPPEYRQDPAFFRSGQRGRDGCRVPIPWSGAKAPYGFGPGEGQPWLPQPDDWGPLSVEEQRADPDSTWSFYRTALEVRRRFRDAGDTVEIVEGDQPGDGVLTLRRGPLTAVCNCGTEPAELPAGEVVVASGPLEGRMLPPDTAVWLA